MWVGGFSGWGGAMWGGEDLQGPTTEEVWEGGA